MPQTAAQKHYGKHKAEISAKNNSHNAARLYAKKHGYLMRSQAATLLDITTQQLSNVEKSVNSNGNVYVYMDEKGKTFYTEQGIESWKHQNKAFYAALKKRTTNLIAFSESFMMIVKFTQQNNQLSSETTKIRVEKEKESLWLRYAE